MARKLITIKIAGKYPGNVNNTTLQSNGSFFKFTDSSTAGAGNLFDGNKFFNGLTLHENIDNIDGGLESDASIVRFYFDRNSQTTTGVIYEATVSIWPVSETDSGLTALTARMSFVNDSTTDTSEEIGNRFMKALKAPGHTHTDPNGTQTHDFWYDQDGNTFNGSTYFDFVNESDAAVTATYAYGSGYAMRVKTKNWMYGVSGSINVFGKVSLKKFENPSERLPPLLNPANVFEIV